ncbi:MAG: phytanoyl-CoA dioxygenase family protein [Microcoleaceae cyanobacterium]
MNLTNKKIIQNQWLTQLSEFQTKGFFTVKGLFDSEEITMWQSECERLSQLIKQRNIGEFNIRSQRICVDGTMTFDRLDPVTNISPLFEKLAGDDRILNLMGLVLGSKPALFKSKLIFKYSGTTGYGLHQDFPYWQYMKIPANALVTLQVNIDYSHKENGAIEFFPGLHHSILPAPVDEPRDVDPSQINLDSSELIEAQPGDICIFHSLAPHRSNTNISQSKRRMLFLIYTTTEYSDKCQTYYTTELGENF